MSNSDQDQDSSSADEQFYSPSEIVKNKTTPVRNTIVNSKKRPLQTSVSSDSPSPTVQKSVTKVLRTGERQSETPNTTIMDQNTRDFLKDLIKTSEERTALLIQQSEDRTANIIKSEIAAITCEVANKFEAETSALKFEVQKFDNEARKKTVWIHGLPEVAKETWRELNASLDNLATQLALPSID
jgi:hypothetical protein